MEYEISVRNKLTYVGYLVARALVNNRMSLNEFRKLSNYALAPNLLLLRTRSQMTVGTNQADDKRRYHVYQNMGIPYNNDVYYATRDWREGSVKPFLQFLRANFPRVDIKKVF